MMINGGAKYLFGRGEKTRTSGLVVPNDARYQLRHTPKQYLNVKITFFCNVPTRAVNCSAL